jgi:hypothetical protein
VARRTANARGPPVILDLRAAGLFLTARDSGRSFPSIVRPELPPDPDAPLVAEDGPAEAHTPRTSTRRPVPAVSAPVRVRNPGREADYRSVAMADERLSAMALHAAVAIGRHCPITPPPYPGESKHDGSTKDHGRCRSHR